MIAYERCILCIGHWLIYQIYHICGCSTAFSWICLLLWIDLQHPTASRYGTAKPSRTSESRAVRRGAGRMRINSPATATAVPSAKILHHYYCS